MHIVITASVILIIQIK